MKLETAVGIVADNAVSFIRNFIAKYEKKNKTQVMILIESVYQFRDNAAVKIVTKTPKGVTVASSMPINEFFMLLLTSDTKISYFVRKAIDGAGGEDHVKEMFRAAIAPKFGNFLCPGDGLHFALSFTSKTTTLLNGKGFVTIREFLDKEISDIIRQEAVVNDEEE